MNAKNIRVRCPYCGRWFEIPGYAFRDPSGEEELDFIIINCPYCRKLVHVWRDGEVEVLSDAYWW